ncbi:unnamed protein product, partial [Closterium sp. NIES-53]
TSGMGLVLGGQSPVVLTGHADASWADDQTTQRSSQGYTFSLGSGSVSWRATRSSSVLGSNCEAEIYARAMAAQELRWLTYLLTDLGEPPRSPPVLYHWREVDRCLTYLTDTRDTALEFDGELESLELIGYVDADNTGDKQNRTSTGGYVFVYGGDVVFWSSSRIKCTTLSSTESEYVAATDAGKEGR